MKLKNLESYLQDLEPFSHPKINLEQYTTPPKDAAFLYNQMLLSQQFDMSNILLADLGCGTGILGIAAVISGCENVYLFEIDEEAIDIAKKNVCDLDMEDYVQFILIDVNKLKDLESFHKKFDIVVTNPPFGTKNNKGADLQFLKSAINICNGYIYSLHKTSTVHHLKIFYNKFGIDKVGMYKIDYNLPKTYKFHKSNNKNIEVSCIEAFSGDAIVKEYGDEEKK